MTYDLTSVQLPRLTGRALRTFAKLVENPLTQKLLLGNLLESGGIKKLRALSVSEPPTYLPFVEQGVSTPKAQTPLPQPDSHPPAAPAGPGFAFKTIRDYAQAYRRGHTTPTEVAERALEAMQRSDESDPAMRIFIAFDPETIRAQAQAATQRISAGQPLSIFDGVPVAVKDEVDMTPYPTTVGTRFLGQTPAREDAATVARMRAAGALLLGKTNMYEIGINPLGYNIHHGTVRNPYNVQHNSGGSSSGSAAAVAAGLCPVAIGADGGGSIRVPAAFCGVVGLKPTYGRVSEHGAAPLCWSVAHLGPLAATAEDAALAHAVLAGPDPRDPNTLSQPAPTLEGWTNTDLTGLTLGVYWPWFSHAAPSVAAACQTLLKQFTDMGAQVREIELPELEACRIAHVVTILSEMAAAMSAYHTEHHRDHGPAVRLNLTLGRAMTSGDYLKAQRVRTRTMAHFRQALAQVDVIVTPTTAISAPFMSPAAIRGDESDLSTVTEIMRFVVPGNFTGLPAISFPAGYEENGLPIGFQAMGKPWDEATLLRLALAAEQVVTRQKPAVHYSILGEE